MKKIILGLIIGISLSCFVAFKVATYEPTKSTSEVEQVGGINIFIKSKPVLEYEVLGSEKTTITWQGKPQEMINLAMKKIEKDYTTAEGVIFTSDDMDRFDIIKFK